MNQADPNLVEMMDHDGPSEERKLTTMEKWEGLPIEIWLQIFVSFTKKEVRDLTEVHRVFADMIRDRLNPMLKKNAVTVGIREGLMTRELANGFRTLAASKYPFPNVNITIDEEGYEPPRYEKRRCFHQFFEIKGNNILDLKIEARFIDIEVIIKHCPNLRKLNIEQGVMNRNAAVTLNNLRTMKVNAYSEIWLSGTFHLPELKDLEFYDSRMWEQFVGEEKIESMEQFVKQRKNLERLSVKIGHETLFKDSQLSELSKKLKVLKFDHNAFTIPFLNAPHPELKRLEINCSYHELNDILCLPNITQLKLRGSFYNNPNMASRIQSITAT